MYYCDMNFSHYNLPNHFSGALGRRSITYFPLATEINGTPGIFLIRCLSALSLVATLASISSLSVFQMAFPVLLDLQCKLDV